MNEWWNNNKQYVKAYAVYVAILWVFQMVVTILQVYTHLTKILQSFGLSQQAGLTIAVLFFWVIFVWLGFIIFRATLKKFITSASKSNNETQNQKVDSISKDANTRL
jgi:hypothetical protein